MTTATPLLEVRNVVKRFPGVIALRGVNLTLHEGEVLALIGENGAGKSTLMKILAGVQQPDEGDVLLDGQPSGITSVKSALERGVALIHQELNLADNLTVGANIFLGREPTKFGLIDQKRIDTESKRWLEAIGLTCSPRMLVGNLAIGQQQMVEIAKALSIGARVLIMDEPTSSLTQHETVALFAAVKDLRDSGVSVVYISHRLSEVKELADRVLVFRDGANAGELSGKDIHHEAMVKLMVGRDVSQFYQHKVHKPGPAMLEVSGLHTPAHPGQMLDFTVHAGEIVGIAGLVGAGRTEMLRTVFGVDRAVGGIIRVAGKPVNIFSPRDAIEAGLALVPEDRKQQGLILEMAVRTNIGLASLRREKKAVAFLNRPYERIVADEMIAALGIKTPGPEQIVQYLSGGNQQKVVLGKWLAMKPRVLMLDEPTRGIDVGAKAEIYALMEKLAKTGVAILFVSSEMEEILGMSDRALVMHEGRITGELQRGELSEEAVMHLATGREAVAV
ncbi:MAG: sugar ABC transporter ATP-binding protein [Phycisphaeraceae bacterium]